MRSSSSTSRIRLLMGARLIGVTASVDRRASPEAPPVRDQVDFQIWGVQIVPTIMPYALAPSGVVGLFQFCTLELATMAQVARSCQM